jgi:hypothetical protein
MLTAVPAHVVNSDSSSSILVAANRQQSSEDSTRSNTVASDTV